MSKPLDELYLTWLYGQVSSVRLKNPKRTWWSLARQLFTKEFVWIVPNDDNRVEDGRDLRQEFIYEYHASEIDPEWLGLGCSFLEMLIGLSRRLAFLAEGDPAWWFWHLLGNLGLAEHSDASHYDPMEVDEVLDRVIWRNYEHDGTGGLFPLRIEPDVDQTEVEIWYQLNYYLIERE